MAAAVVAGGWNVFTGFSTKDYNNGQQPFYNQNAKDRNFNNGLTFLRVTSSSGIGVQLSASGKGRHDSMYLQNLIHAIWNIPRFKTFAPESIQGTILTSWE